MVVEFHDMDKHQEECEYIFTRLKEVGYKFEIAERPELSLSTPSTWNGSHIVRINSETV